MTGVRVARSGPEKEHTTMTSTTPTAFEIFSRTTGHSFGTWDATTASEAMDQMEAQAGEIDRSDLEALLVVTEADIKALRREAREAGDEKQVELCDLALDGDTSAERACAKVIREALYAPRAPCYAEGRGRRLGPAR